MMITSAFCAGVLSLLAAADGGAEALTTAPVIGPLPALHMPKPDRFTLGNGLKVLAVPRHTAPLVALRLVVDAGAAADPAALTGLAAATADMLDEGAGPRGALDLARDLEALGASLFARADRDIAQLGLEVPAAGFAAALAIAADLVVSPRLDDGEWQRVKNDRLTALLQRRDQPRAVAEVVGNRILYGDDDPYGRPVDGYRKTMDNITRADLVKFFAERWRPAGATLIVAGDYDPKQLRAQLGATFGVWKPAPGAAPRAATSPMAKDKVAKLPRFVLVDRPAAPQTVLRVLGPGLPRSSPARAPLTLVSTVFGGSFLSRLNANLREEKGYTYGARGGFHFERRNGAFDAGADVFTKVTDKALSELLKETTLIAQAPVRADELGKARAIELDRLAEELATTEGTAGVFAELAAHGEAPDAPERFLRALGQQSPTAMAKVTAAHLHPDDLTIIVVGDRASIEAPLRALGLPAPQLRDADGDPLE